MDDAVATERLSTYLVEGYRPGVSLDALEQATQRLRAAAEQMASEGKPVQYVRYTIVPDDEAYLLLMKATSESLVREAYARAEIPFERISTAISEDG